MRTVAGSRPLGYAYVYKVYRWNGWTPLPLPRGQKFPPPHGYTGESGALPTPDMFRYWADEHADGNVALVMPPDVIGIDIDAYHGGLATFRNLLKKYGYDIPNTVYSTSRTDGSGIFFYRVPLGTRLVGKIDGGIEIIQHHHRYAVVSPSIHPEGRTYQWRGADGQPEDFFKIRVADLPELPEAWLNGLSSRKQVSTGTGYDGSSQEWFDGLRKGILPMSVSMDVFRAINRLRTEGGRYDTMVTMLARLVGLGANGYPVADAINDLFDAYVAAVDGERHAESEFDRALEGAIKKFGVK